MLRFTFSSTTKAKRADVGGGNKDKMMMVVLGGVIVVAIGALIWSFVTGGEPSTLDEVTEVRCVACGHVEEMSKGDANEKFMEIPDEQRRGLQPMRIMCSECGDKRYTAVVGMVCPKCGKGFVSKKALAQVKSQLGLPIDPSEYPGPKTECPHCGVDVHDWWRKHKGDKKK